ncbi:uncharacterized protein [Malus domestica]|uniref:uncharacterized protein isoform X4 n=1 Tax=Malus domestica TaxID=3750 RepID=UPI0004988267
MTSFKKLDHRQSTMTLVERSKMLAAKPKFGIGQNRLVSHVLRFIQKVTLPKLIPGSVNKVSAVENTASLKVTNDLLILLLVLRWIRMECYFPSW